MELVYMHKRRESLGIPPHLPMRGTFTARHERVTQGEYPPAPLSCALLILAEESCCGGGEGLGER